MGYGINFRSEVGSTVNRVEISGGGGGGGGGGGERDVRTALGVAGERRWIREVIVESGNRAGKGMLSHGGTMDGKSSYEEGKGGGRGIGRGRVRTWVFAGDCQRWGKGSHGRQWR